VLQESQGLQLIGECLQLLGGQVQLQVVLQIAGNLVQRPAIQLLGDDVFEVVEAKAPGRAGIGHLDVQHAVGFDLRGSEVVTETWGRRSHG
jgi:hypothetical protein